jgi:iron complex outermembrane receptor protein
VNPENYIAGTQTFKPEVLDDVEVGVKSDWTVAGMKVRTNADVFRSYFKSVQNQSSFDFGKISIIENNGKVTITGVELEASLQPNLWDGFQLSGSYAYNYAHYNEINNVILPPGTVLDPSIAAVPLNKFSLTARQKFTFVPEDYGDVSGQVTWNYQTRSNFGGLIYYTTGAEQAAYGIVNLRVDWDHAYGYPVDLSFFMTNVLDRVYQSGNFPVQEVAGFYSSVYAEPRMFGFQAKYEW